MPDTNQDPTAGYTTPPKGPNFGLIVAMSCVVFLILLVVAVLLIHSKGTKLVPHAPTSTPNALVRPMHPFTGLPTHTA